MLRHGFVLAAVLSFPMAAAHADIIASFTGVVTGNAYGASSLFPYAPGGSVQVGDTVTGTITIDQTLIEQTYSYGAGATDYVPNYGDSDYANSVTISITIDGSTVSMNSGYSYGINYLNFTVDSADTPPIYNFSAAVDDTSGSSLGQTIFVSYSEDTPFLTSGTLTQSFADGSGTADISSLYWGDSSSSQTSIDFTLSSITYNSDGAESVPEPSGLAVFAFAVAGLAAVRRRRA